MCRWVTNYPNLSDLKQQFIIALIVLGINWAHLICPHLEFLMGSHSGGSRHLKASLCWSFKMAHAHG